MSDRYMTQKAFGTVAGKVAELQDAIADLASVFETNGVGLDEWCEDLTTVLEELEQEVFAEDE